MDSLLERVTTQLNQLSELRERFVIRIECLPADLTLLGLMDELREAAFSTTQLCHLQEQQAAFPLARLAFEAAQRVIVLATDEKFERVGIRAWLYYARKDMKIAQFARDVEVARKWYEQKTGELLNIWSRHSPTAESAFREANEELDVFQKRGKADNFMGEDLGHVVAERYSKLAIGSGRSAAEMKQLNRGIYAALSRESHARNRLEPERMQVSPDGRVTVVPQAVDKSAKARLVLGCLDSSLAEANAAVSYLVRRRAQHHSDQLRQIAANLAAKPLPPNFKPDLGLHLIKEGQAASTLRFPNVPVQKVGIFSDGTVRWSGNITLAAGEVYAATFDVPYQLAPDLARALGVDEVLIAPGSDLKKQSFVEPLLLFLECVVSEIQESPGGSFAPLKVVKVNSGPMNSEKPS